MGYASYLVYRDGVGEPRNLALALYGGQLALNWAYFPIFFRFKKLGLVILYLLLVVILKYILNKILLFLKSFVVLCALGANIAACVWKFYPINKNASYLMIPYLIWVAVGSVVDFNFWRLNKNRKPQ